ncbi:MAG: hypothetical protein CMQ43_02915 [Gammaproteobacteria bacterium]|jgi:hypothetical protein|nr:hypothetical protein [Gammaproteobacteria bacterium]|tara:strand:+ start:19424 stop:19888 length:465 start_codon:yes stop_codon:yes gene_type:complete
MASPTGAPDTTVRWTSGINAVAGVWLVIAPFALGYSAVSQALWNDLLVGTAVVVLALTRVVSPRHRPALSWVNILLGIWLIVAPFILLYGATAPTAAGPASATDAATGNDVLVGIIVLVMASWSARASHGLAGETGASLQRTTVSTSERGGPNV